MVPARLHPTTRTFHADLKAAGIALKDADGRVVDFHALRTTFVSWLNMTGAHPRTAQALARHSSIELTMGAYSDVRLLDLRAAIDRLPLPELPNAACPGSNHPPNHPSGVTEAHSGALSKPEEAQAASSVKA